MLDMDAVTKEAAWSAVEGAATDDARGAAYRTALQTSIGSNYKIRLTRDGDDVLSFTFTGTLPIVGKQIVISGSPGSPTYVDADIDSGTWVGFIESSDASRWISGTVSKSGTLFVLAADIVAADGVTMTKVIIGVPSSFDATTGDTGGDTGDTGGGPDIDPNVTRKDPPRAVKLWLRDTADGPVVVPDDYVGLHVHAYPNAGNPPGDENWGSPSVYPEPDENAYGTFRNHNNDHAGFMSRNFPTEVHAGNWTELDAVFNYYTGKGKTLFGNIFAFPPFLSSREGSAWPAYPGIPGGAWCPDNDTDWTKWEARVERMTDRYTFNVLESANEPSLGWLDNRVAFNSSNFWGGTDTDNSEAGKARRRRTLARNQYHVHEGGKAGDSGVRILSPGFVWWSEAEFNQIDAFMNESTGVSGIAADFTEGLSCHHYQLASEGTSVFGYATELKRLKTYRDANAPDMTLDQSESGIGEWGSKATYATHALVIKRKSAVGAALGYKHNVFYSYDSFKGQINGTGWWLGNPADNAVSREGLTWSHANFPGKTIIQGAILDNDEIWLHYGDGTELRI